MDGSNGCGRPDAGLPSGIAPGGLGLFRAGTDDQLDEEAGAFGAADLAQAAQHVAARLVGGCVPSRVVAHACAGVGRVEALQPVGEADCVVELEIDDARPLDRDDGRHGHGACPQQHGLAYTGVGPQADL